MCGHLSEKVSKGRFLKPENLQNHSNEVKGKEKKKEKKKERRRRKKKTMVALLVFIIATLAENNSSMQKVHLATTLSKIRLDIQSCKSCI